jgi:putative DNA primase/helicase
MPEPIEPTPTTAPVPAETPAASAAPVVQIPPPGGWSTLETEELAALITTIQANIKHDFQFFYDPNNVPWARVLIGGQNGHYEHMEVKGETFKTLVTKRLRDDMGGMPRPSWVNSTIQECVGMALWGEGEVPAQKHTMHLRTAGHNNAIYIDLGDERWRIVKITSSGWSVISNEVAPVRFRRPQGMLPLPVPLQVQTSGLSVGGVAVKSPAKFLQFLFNFVNVKPQDRILVLSWLIAAFRPSGPYPILAFHGQQGSAKTSSQKLLKSLIDPSVAPLRSAPRNEHDLMISAKQSYVLGFDNFSKIDQQLSDALCRLVTGGGFATRKLRTDDTQMIFDATRTIMLNGISDVAERGDLMERMLSIQCPPLTDGKRETERNLERRFRRYYPFFLGALCSVVSKTMAAYSVKIRTSNRMQDFTSWAIAAEEALGYKNGEFLKAYRANQEELRYNALETPIIAQLLEWRSQSNMTRDWTGTPKDLLQLIYFKRGGNSSVTPEKLRRELDRAEPALRSVGIFIMHLPRDGRFGRRLRIWEKSKT